MDWRIDTLDASSAALVNSCVALIFNAFAVRQVARWNAPLIDQPSDERADWQIVNGLGAALALRGCAPRPFFAGASPRTLISRGRFAPHLFFAGASPRTPIRWNRAGSP